MPIDRTSIQDSAIGPKRMSRPMPAPGSWYVPPPMKNWKVYRIASERPMLTIITCTSPRPLRRSGLHKPASSVHPSATPVEDDDRDREPHRYLQPDPEA